MTLIRPVLLALAFVACSGAPASVVAPQGPPIASASAAPRIAPAHVAFVPPPALPQRPPRLAVSAAPPPFEQLARSACRNPKTGAWECRDLDPKTLKFVGKKVQP